MVGKISVLKEGAKMLLGTTIMAHNNIIHISATSTHNEWSPICCYHPSTEQSCINSIHLPYSKHIRMFSEDNANSSTCSISVGTRFKPLELSKIIHPLEPL